MATPIPTSEELQFLEDRLYEFKCAQTGQDDGQLIAFFHYDAYGTLMEITGY